MLMYSILKYHKHQNIEVHFHQMPVKNALSLHGVQNPRLQTWMGNLVVLKWCFLHHWCGTTQTQSLTLARFMASLPASIRARGSFISRSCLSVSSARRAESQDKVNETELVNAHVPSWTPFTERAKQCIPKSAMKCIANVVNQNKNAERAELILLYGFLVPSSDQGRLFYLLLSRDGHKNASYSSIFQLETCSSPCGTL